MYLHPLLLVLLVLFLFGSFPVYGYSKGWGYGPSGVIGVIFVVIIIMYLMGGVRLR